MKQLLIIISLMSAFMLPSFSASVQETEPPTENQGANAMDAKIRAQSNGLLRLVKFEKIGGKTLSFFGIESHTMQCTVEVTAIEDCEMTGFEMGQWNGSFEVLKLVKNTDSTAADKASDIALVNGKRLESGEKLRLGANLKFDLTDQGWAAEGRPAANTPFVPDLKPGGGNDKALADCSDAITRSPKNSDAYINRGVVYRIRGEIDKAVEDYSTALQLDAKNIPAILSRGDLYRIKKEYDKAIADYAEVIQLEPKVVAAYKKRALVYWQKKEYDRAIDDYNDALRLEPQNAGTYLSRGQIYAVKNEHDKAIADYSAALQLDPKNAMAFNQRGDAYFERGDNEKALGDFSEAIHLYPQNMHALLIRGGIYSTKSEHDKAIADYSEVIRLDPDNADAYAARGDCYFKKGDYAKSTADCSTAVKFDRNNAAACHTLARIWATCPQNDLRDGKKAVEYATRACELSGWGKPDYVDTLAAAYAEAGDFENAVKWQTKRLKTPNLSEKDSAEGKLRLALYQAHKPFHIE